MAGGTDPAGGMVVKRPILTLAALCLGLILGACSSQFAGSVADHWPHWAGGEPAGVPPRPGSPGYQDYIAHRQAEGALPAPAAPAASASAVAAPAAAAVQGSSPAPTGDSGVARGGLY